MLNIVAKFSVHPEKVEQFKAVVKPLVEKSRQEVGCVSYALHQQKGSVTEFAMLEVWRDEAAIAQHNQSAHFVQILPKLANYLTKEAQITIYEDVKDC